jgi:hypothetical protein
MDRNFFFAVESSPILGPTENPIQLVPEAFFPQGKQPGVMLTPLHLVPKVKIYGAILTFLHTFSWHCISLI